MLNATCAETTESLPEKLPFFKQLFLTFEVNRTKRATIIMINIALENISLEKYKCCPFPKRIRQLFSYEIVVFNCVEENLPAGKKIGKRVKRRTAYD